MRRFADPFACVDREALDALAGAYGAFVFLVDALGSPGPVPVKDGEAYRPGVEETIAWHPGHKEVVKLLYHSQHNLAVTFLSPPAGRGVWEGLAPLRMRELSLAAGYTVGCFVVQYHPCDRLLGYPEMLGCPAHPALAALKGEPGLAQRLPLVARLMVAVATAKVYPQRTCLVGLAPDDAYAVACARKLLRADIDFIPAPEFFSRCLRPGSVTAGSS